jgi:hypothetical protein
MMTNKKFWIIGALCLVILPALTGAMNYAAYDPKDCGGCQIFTYKENESYGYSPYEYAKVEQVESLQLAEAMRDDRVFVLLRAQVIESTLTALAIVASTVVGFFLIWKAWAGLSFLGGGVSADLKVHKATADIKLARLRAEASRLQDELDLDTKD